MNTPAAVYPRGIIIVGPNGAGKTTFAHAFLPRDAGILHFVNADLIPTATRTGCDGGGAEFPACLPAPRRHVGSFFPLLFYKRLCDVFDEETHTALAESGGDKQFALFPEKHCFQIPRSSAVLQNRSTW